MRDNRMNHLYLGRLIDFILLDYKQGKINYCYATILIDNLIQQFNKGELSFPAYIDFPYWFVGRIEMKRIYNNEGKINADYRLA
jgi:hypothetical protein